MVAPAPDTLIRKFVEWIEQGEQPPAYETPAEFGPRHPDGHPRYLLSERVGVGAHGEVYRATDRLLQGEVAIKIVADATTSRMLLNEAAAVQHLTHPRIVRLREVVVDGQTVALAYELIDGVPLDRWVELQPEIGPKQAAEVMLQVCEAVGVAHGAGVVHLDLKPANILMDADGAKVADFGIARVVGDWSTHYSARGSVAFMAPEQAHMDETICAPRMDVYALGGLLAWMVTGACPNEPDLLHRDLGTTRTVRPEVLRLLGDVRDTVLRRIILRAIDPDPARRHQTAAELADDLRRWRDRRPIDWQRPSVPRRLVWFARRRPWTAAGVGAAVAAIVGLTGALAHAHAAAETRLVEAELDKARAVAEAHTKRLAAARRLTRLIVDYTKSLETTTPTPDLLTAAMIFESITDDAVLDMTDVRESIDANRIDVVGRLIEQERAAGRGDEMLARLWENGLGVWQYRAGRYREAGETLASSLAWLDRVIGTDDAWRQTTRAVLLCARARLGADGGAEARAALAALLPELTHRWVADEVRAVLDAGPGPGDSGGS